MTDNISNDANENQILWPKFKYSGLVKPWKRLHNPKVPDNIQRPDYANHPRGQPISEIQNENRPIEVLDQEEIEKMRVVCSLAREVLDEVSKIIAPGITTEDIDKLVLKECIARNSYPSPLNYYKFPKCSCTSINEVVCHGIPDSRPLKDGEIVNVDVTLYHDGYHGDLNETFFVGTPSPVAIKLVSFVHECLREAIKIVKPGVPYNEIGRLIEELTEKNGYSVVRNYTGHGVHKYFHCPPTVYHRKNKYRHIMKAGHVFTIEPMINLGGSSVIDWPDDWTVTTKDGKLSAQFEQTLLVTEYGCEILTGRLNNPYRAYFMDQLEKMKIQT